ARLDVEPRLFSPLIAEVDLMLDRARHPKGKRPIALIAALIYLDGGPALFDSIIVADLATNWDRHIGRHRTADPLERHLDLRRLILNGGQKHAEWPLGRHVV